MAPHIFNDQQAFILANVYGLSPPRKIGRYRSARIDTGKFEPDRLNGEPIRTITLAHWLDKTNILIKYAPAEFLSP